jgi:triacylglycerol lipase
MLPAKTLAIAGGAVAGSAAVAVTSALAARTVRRRHEAREAARLLRDASRSARRICATRYPVLLVPGVSAMDMQVRRYWGRIPDALEANGARVYKAWQQSTRSVADAGFQLGEIIEATLAESGASKLNLIAHSKGGMDARWAISQLGFSDRVASLTTMCTPHRGCDYGAVILRLLPRPAKWALRAGYERAHRRDDVPSPDLLAMARDMTPSQCQLLNEMMVDAPVVLYQSAGVTLALGPWDGVVPTSSMQWGDWLGLIRPSGPVGITHSDAVDLTGVDVGGFDVTEWYVQLVAGLKDRGL